MSEVLKRVSATLAAGSAGQVIIFLTRFLLVPLYLSAWGTAGYGRWMLISSLAAYLGALDIGVQMYVLNRLTQAYSRGDLEDYERQRNTAFAYYAVVAALGTAALALFAYTADVSRLLRTGMPNTEVAHILVLLGAGVVWALPASIIWNTPRTAGKPAAAQWLNNLQAASVLVLSATALVLFPNMTLVAAIPLLSVLVAGVVAYEYNRRRVPDVSLGLRGVSVGVAKSMLRPSAFFGLIVIAVAIGQQVPLLLISHELGLAAVAVFAVARTLTGMIRQLVALLSNSVLMDLTRLETTGDTERLSSAMRILVAVSMTAAISLAGVLWFDLPSIIRPWTGDRIDPDMGLLRLMLLYVILQTVWMSASNIPAATNRHRALSISYLVSNVAAVGLSALLLPELGLNAIPIAFIAAELIACVHFVLRDACRIAGMDYPAYATRLLAGSALMSSSILALAFAIHATIPGGAVATLTASVLVLPLVAAGIGWRFLFTNQDRTRLAGWAKKIHPLREPA